MSELVRRDGPGFVVGSLTALLFFVGIFLLTIVL
jgi:hypothetical protein